MTKKEIVNRNIGLTFDFVREIMKQPSLAGQLPAGAEIEFVEKDFLVKNEKALGNKYIIKVKSVFEPVNKVAEPKAKYFKKGKN
ncbi:MAG TPA: hypothetical protein VJY62_15460 [Bacteroidia bacterium]|nr:hypothetical protein [Bacteroidia bacterium]